MRDSEGTRRQLDGPCLSVCYSKFYINKSMGPDHMGPKCINNMNRRKEEDVLKGRTDILQTLSNPVKLSENKGKVVHLEWSQPMQQDRLGM